MKKLLSIGIILLFFGLAVFPSINANNIQNSINDDLIEVNVEVSGINGFKPNTVKLTRQQYDKVKNIFREVQTKLESTEKMIDAIPIYYNAVIELNNYGLLPDEMNVETAQKLVTGGYKDKESTNFFRETSDTNQNYLCFLVGTIFDPFNVDYVSFLLLAVLLMSLPLTAVGFILAFLLGIPNIAFYFLAIALTKAVEFPLAFMTIMRLKESESGLIATLGLNGFLMTEGDMNGIIAGFTGIKIWDTHLLNLLGFSLYTNLEIV